MLKFLFTLRESRKRHQGHTHKEQGTTLDLLEQDLDVNKLPQSHPRNRQPIVDERDLRNPLRRRIIFVLNAEPLKIKRKVLQNTM